MTLSLEDLYARTVLTPEGCRVWRGSTYPKGYGRVYVGRQKYRLAHRLLVEMTDGVTLLTSQFVIHHCDNPPCIERAHLLVADHDTNMADMKAKGRGRSGGLDRPGVSHPLHKVTDEDVLAMRRAWDEGPRYWGMQSDMCARYGLTSGQVSNIVNRKVWTHLP